MKQIIKGVTYDTKNAEQLAGAGLEGRDEFLYRTKNGRYFVHRDYMLFDGRRRRPHEDVRAAMGGTWDAKRISHEHEIVPLTRPQALLWSIEMTLPDDFQPDLFKLVRSAKARPAATRHQAHKH